MKPLLIWLAVVAVVFGGYALITSAVRDTEQVFVVVDSSFQMRPVWSDVELELDRIDNEEHAEFALATEKGPVHSWQPELDARRRRCRSRPARSRGSAFAEAIEADRRILITTSANDLPHHRLVDWEIIELEP